MSREQYQAVKEIADLLKIDEATVSRWIKDGELPAIDIGKEWRIGADDLDALLEGHAPRPAARPNGGTETSPEETATQNTKEQKN